MYDAPGSQLPPPLAQILTAGAVRVAKAFDDRIELEAASQELDDALFTESSAPIQNAANDLLSQATKPT